MLTEHRDVIEDYLSLQNTLKNINILIMKIAQYSRVLHHRVTGAGVVFTNPTSNDHTDGTWNTTDLYIGEIGINVTDDKAYFRTNNGIIELGTATSSTASQIWQFNSDEVSLSPTITADAVTRNTNAFTDLGTSALRFKDLYLGGSFAGNAVINVNADVTMRTTARTIYTTLGNASNDNATFVMATQSSTGLKTVPLFVNSNDSTAQGQNVSLINTSGGTVNSIRGTIISGLTASITGNNSVYMLNGYGRTFSRSNAVGIGGELALRGVTDDGSGMYINSDNIRGQARVQTTNATVTPIFILPHIYDEVISVKLFVSARDISDVTKAYTATILFMAYADTSRNAIAHNPIITEINTFNNTVNVIPTTDGTDLTINVQGTSTNTIKWLVTYEYQRIQN